MALRAVTSIVVGVAITLSACGGHGDSQPGEEQSRLEVMQRRLDQLDQRLATTEKDLAADARLSEDVRALEQRLGAVDAKATQALDAAKRPPAPAAAPAGTGAGAGAAARLAPPDPLEHRAQLGALMTEYRRRLSDMAKQQDAQTSAADRLAARRSLRAWYIAHRRAILAGRPLPDWHPETP
jgi:hypothetical protein